MAEDSPQDDFRTLWTLATGDIQFFKSQQYTVTNYALLIYAALGALPLTKGQSPELRWQVVLSVLVVAVAIFGVRLVFSLQRALAKSRRYMRAARLELSTDLIRVMAKVRGGSDTAIEKRKPGDVDRILATVIVLGAMLSLAFIWHW